MNAITKFIKQKETKVFRFVPNPDFYKEVKINKKRWGLLYRGEKEPTFSEIQRIANYFNVPITEFINE